MIGEKTKYLKDLVAGLFEAAPDKKAIDNLAKINAAVEDVEKENEELVNENAELIKSYKELTKHTSFKTEPARTETQPAKAAPDLESFLKDFLTQKNEK